MDPACILELPGIIELFGEAGSGKSQMCQYLSAVFVTKNEGKRVLYISLDGIYRPERFFNYLRRMHSNDCPGDMVLIHHEFESESLRTFVCERVPIVCQRLDVGLIIIDSIAAVFRLADQAMDKFFLFDIMKALRKLSRNSSIAIIVVNQISAKVSTPADASQIDHLDLAFRPALGLQWSNCVDHRLWMCKDISGKFTKCTLERSPMYVPGSEYLLSF